MRTMKLDPKAIEQIFNPTTRIANPADALHRMIYSAKVRRYFTLDRLAGTFLLMGAAEPEYNSRLRRKPLGGWFTAQEFESWDDVLDWADKMQALICLPGPATQGDALVAIYRLVFDSDWDKIVKLDGWPACNKETWKVISKSFMEFDRVHHPDVLPGGAWMNSGFSSLDGEHLEDWQVRLCGIITAEQQQEVSHAA
jgi:hypothetical protein